MPSFREQLQEHVLDLVWSLWVEFGVSGWQRRHTSHAIDPEPLIVFTAWLGDTDPRLRDESVDWCIRYGRYVAAARLRNILAREDAPVRGAFGAYAATVGAHSPFRWPIATKPRRYEPTGGSQIGDFERPSLIALRLRALFGVGGRAETIRVLLARRGEALTAGEIADEVEYTKRNLAEALESLKMAGLVAVEPVRNQLRYRLARQKELLMLIGRRPEFFPVWKPVFRILASLLDLASRVDDMDPRVRAVEAHRTLRALAPEFRRAGIEGRAEHLGPERVWIEVQRWGLEFASRIASGDADAFRKPPPIILEATA